MKHICIYTLVILFFCSHTKKESIKLDFEDAYYSINSDTIKYTKKYLIKTNKFDLLFNEKAKRKKEKEYGTIYSYYKRSGIKIISPIEYPQVPSSIEIYFQENGNLNEKMSMFDGELIFFGKRITKNSTFMQLINDTKLHSMIDSLNLKANYFDISTEHGQYFVHFDGMGGDSKIDFLTATL